MGLAKKPKNLPNQGIEAKKKKRKEIKRSNPAKKLVFLKPSSLMKLMITYGPTKKPPLKRLS